MAGPITRRFVEAIEWTVAHNVVQMARNRPKHLVLFIRGMMRPMPYLMITKYDEDLTDAQFKMRMYRGFGGGWDEVPLVFTSLHYLKTFLVENHDFLTEPDFLLGCKSYDEWPNVTSITTYYQLDKFSTAMYGLDEEDVDEAVVLHHGINFDRLIGIEIDFLVSSHFD